MNKSALEAKFAWAMKACGRDLPEPVREYRFHPTRKWRFDWAYPDVKLAIECDGGKWAPHGGRHNTTGDREKLNEAARLGWRILRFDGDMLKLRASECVDHRQEVVARIKARQARGEVPYAVA
jgi:very-short-patch-repair endonuclease